MTHKLLRLIAVVSAFAFVLGVVTFARGETRERERERTTFRIEHGHVIERTITPGSTVIHETDRGPVDRIQPRERREIVRPR